MGLAVSVGSLAALNALDEEGAGWLRESFRAVNRVLEGHGLPTHDEPERFEASIDDLRQSCLSFPYSDLHLLRRSYAYMREGLSPIPDDDSLTDQHAAVIEAASEKFDSHLLCHSDCEGMYVPIDFAEPIFDEDLPGVLLGSSHALLRELHSLASHIGIEFSEGRPTRACEAELQDPDYDGPFTTERVVWYAMWEAATMSIQYRTAITFE